MKKSDIEKMKKYNRYEVRIVEPHFGQRIVGIYQTLKEAELARENKLASQDMRVIVYDTHKRERV